MRFRAAAVAVSVVLLAPCFWQPHIQAGDLSSHIYNAWLAQLIERGQAPGLTLATQSNNVLFDLIISGLMRAVGAAAAERIAVSIAVLVFFWGAFAYVWRHGRAPWQLAPCLAMLAYGWVFHMGLFNFYMSLGLSFAALAMFGRRDRWRAAAAVLFGAAYVAHALPVVWAIGVLVYERAARAVAPRRRVWLLGVAIVGIAMAGFVIGGRFVSTRGPGQFAAMTGVDQVWIYGRKYIAVAIALLGCGVLSFTRVVAARGMARLIFDTRFQLCVIAAASLVLLPDGVLLPGFRHGLMFLAERMSLALAVLFCALIASVKLPKLLVGVMAVVAAVFFGFSYSDERGLNALETRMEQAVRQLPPGQRVITELADPASRVNPLVHLVDRICVGRCFSYANYEPSTAQFRVRANGANPIVVADYRDSWNMQNGGYVVKARDLPLYNVDFCGARICVEPVAAGTILRSRDWAGGSAR